MYHYNSKHSKAIIYWGEKTHLPSYKGVLRAIYTSAWVYEEQKHSIYVWNAKRNTSANYKIITTTDYVLWSQELLKYVHNYLLNFT